MPRIVLIHATPVAMAPVREVFAADWPEAEVADLLDETLTLDRARSAEKTPELICRIRSLADHARGAGADAILYTCSAFGVGLGRVARDFPIPVLKPNEAMFDAALAAGRRIAMIYTFAPAAAGMEAEFREAAAAACADAELVSVLAPGAMDALRAGDRATHDRIVAETAAGLAGIDVIMLAHFSTAPAQSAVSRVTDVPVLTSPASAVARLRALLGAEVRSC